MPMEAYVNEGWHRHVNNEEKKKVIDSTPGFGRVPRLPGLGSHLSASLVVRATVESNTRGITGSGSPLISLCEGGRTTHH
jgi:hypothetical protein